MIIYAGRNLMLLPSILINIKFADIAEERRGCFIEYERSVIIMTFFRLSYLIHSLDNCVTYFSLSLI